jgi:hypothetical protein
MKNTIEMGSDAMIYISGFIKIVSAIQNFIGGGGVTKTHRQNLNRIKSKSKCKAIPVTGREGDKVISLTRRPRFTPQENYLTNSWYSFLLSLL